MHACAGEVSSSGMRRLGAGWSMAILLFAASARGHGGTPVAQGILVNPSDPGHVVVTTQYGGLFQTHDGGSSWEWVCEQAVGYRSIDAPPATLTASGSMAVAVAFEGISSGGSTCAFSLWPTDASAPHFPDLRLVPEAPSEVLALRSNYTGSAYVTEVWRGDPQTSSWAVVGQPLAADLIGVSLGAAPGDPNRLYVAGGTLDPDSQKTLPVFETTRNGGTSFSRYAPSLDGVLRLIAVSSDASATAYVLLQAFDGVDQILVFTDAGTTHHVVFSATGRLPAGALSPDGSELVVGGPDDGLWRASTSDLQSGTTNAFAKVSSLSTRALAWTDQGLYSGGNAVTDGFSVGVSHDRGETFSPFLVLCKVTGPVSCAGGCPVDGQYGWSSLQAFFPFTGCESESEPPPVEEEEPNAAPRGGCGCESAASRRMPAGSWLAVGLAAALLARRRSLPERRARRLPGRHEARARR